LKNFIDRNNRFAKGNLSMQQRLCNVIAFMVKSQYTYIFSSLFYLGLLSFGCQSGTTENQGAPSLTSIAIEEDMDKVSVQLLQKTDFNQEIISQGKIEARYRSDVTFELDEKIESINIRVGQKVKKGQILATLDDFAYQYELEKIDQKIEQAKLSIEEKLISLGYSSDFDEIDSALVRRISVKYDLYSLYSDKKKAQRELEQTKVKAPISGVIVKVEAQANNPSSNYETLCTIIDDESLQIVFPILEAEIAKIGLNHPIKFQPLYQTNKFFEGKISIITPEVDEFGMIKTYAEIKNPPSSLFEGMKVEVIIQSKVPAQLIVPKSAVVDRQGQQVVFTYKNGVAYWNYVKLGQENTKSYTIIEGLSAGDTIIIDNNLYLAHEEQVSPIIQE